MNPILSKIRIYPIKSLDPVELSQVKIGVRSLLGDRRYALIHEDGGFINGKRTGRVNQLETSFDGALEQVSFQTRGIGEKITFHLEREKQEIERYLSEFFSMKVHFLRNDQGRLLDVPDESAVTVVAQETYQELSDALSDPLDRLRLRFRANLEISQVPSYWEELLVSGNSETGVPFRIGEVNFLGIRLRARCNVPPRNPFTGETDKTFIKKMLASRESSVPPWSSIRNLDSLYHLTVDTFIPDAETGKEIKVGDHLEIL